MPDPENDVTAPESKELAPDLPTREKYTDADRLKYVAALFASLLAMLVGIAYQLWPLVLVAFVCVWLVDRKGRDVYRSFRRRRRIR